jgi:hypothetical protein
MGIGIGTIVFADGAILAWAVDARTVGYVLLAVGALSLALSVGRRGYAAFGRWRAAPGRLGQP